MKNFQIKWTMSFLCQERIIPTVLVAAITEDKPHGGQTSWRTNLMEDKPHGGQTSWRTNLMEDKAFKEKGSRSVLSVKKSTLDLKQ
jgi:hypothetical protein